jgi:hypothetical protein
MNIRHLKHGEHIGGRSKLYVLWENMLNRVRPESPHSPYYFDRGITVCAEWRDAATFFKWAKTNGYKPWLEIDRENNDRDYCPENCRFVTRSKQNINRRKRPDFGIYKRGDKYRVFLTRFGIIFHAGSAATIEAARAKRDALIENLEI